MRRDNSAFGEKKSHTGSEAAVGSSETSGLRSPTPLISDIGVVIASMGCELSVNVPQRLARCATPRISAQITLKK